MTDTYAFEIVLQNEKFSETEEGKIEKQRNSRGGRWKSVV